MIKKMIIVLLLISNLTISGCMYREFDPFKQSNDDDYKFRFNLFGLFEKKETKHSYVIGIVLLEDHATPLVDTHIVLKKQSGELLASDGFTNDSGMFIFAQLLQNGAYVVEIDSPGYVGSKSFKVETDKSVRLEIFATKK